MNGERKKFNHRDTETRRTKGLTPFLFSSCLCVSVVDILCLRKIA